MRTKLWHDAEPLPVYVPGIPTVPPRPPSPPDSFEFVRVGGTELCAAEDIFLRGQLLPYKPPPSSAASNPAPTLQSRRTAYHGGEHKRCSSDQDRHLVRQCRSTSLDGYGRSRVAGGGEASRLWKDKDGLPVDYRRLPTLSETWDARAAKRSGVTSPRPKWYLLAFGSARVPAEMDMKDIRSRMRRRSTSPSTGSGAVRSSVESVGGGEKNGRGSGTWKLLRSLSCKADVVGVVDTSLDFELTQRFS